MFTFCVCISLINFDQLFVCCLIVYSDQLFVSSSYTGISYHDTVKNQPNMLRLSFLGYCVQIPIIKHLDGILKKIEKIEKGATKGIDSSCHYVAVLSYSEMPIN